MNPRTLNIGFIISLAIVLICGCTVVEKTPLEAIKGTLGGPSVRMEEPKILVASEYNLGHGYFAFPKIIIYSDDLWLVAFATEGDTYASARISVDNEGNLPERIRVPSPLISTNRGHSWFVKAPSALLEARTNYANAPVFRWHFRDRHVDPFFSLIRRRNGELLGFYEYVMAISRNYDSVRKDWEGVGTVMRFTPDGRWSPPEDVFFKIPMMLKSREAMWCASIIQKGIELEDGTLLVVGYSDALVPYKNESNLGYATVLFESTDNGRSFRIRSVIASGRHVQYPHEGPSEPAIERLPNGELYCVMRAGAHGAGHRIKDAEPMLSARSVDNGYTWTVSKFPYRGVAPKLHLMSNGVLVCGFGRPGNSLAFSRDGGRTWSRQHYLSPPSWPTTGYLDFAEVASNRLFVVYDLWDYDSTAKKAALPDEGQNVVMGRFVEVIAN